MAANPQPPATAGEPTYCSVCAWRATCQKKFSFDQGGSAKCPEYTRDLSLASPDKDPHEK